ncbi:MAG: hypothetical protein IJL34_01160 [Treponema sp.]|nr:hypothetical protein [Treponema sp.]
MKKLSVLILAAAALFAGCNNLTVEKNKDSKSGNVTINIGNQSRTISPMSGVSLEKIEEWTITFEDQNGFIDDIVQTGMGGSFTFTVPAGLYTVTAESSYTPKTADGNDGTKLTLIGEKTDVEIGDYTPVNISVGLKKEETGDFKYTLTGYVSGFVSLVNMKTGVLSYSAKIQEEEPSDEPDLKAVYNSKTLELVVTGTGLKSGFYKMYITDTDISGAENPDAVIYYDIGDFLVEIADDLETTGFASSVSESQTQVVYFGTNDTTATGYNGKFPFARKNVNEILKLLITNKKWQFVDIYMDTDSPELDVVVINQLRKAMIAGDRSESEEGYEVNIINPAGETLIALSATKEEATEDEASEEWKSYLALPAATKLSLNADSEDKYPGESKKLVIDSADRTDAGIQTLTLEDGVTVVTTSLYGINQKELTVKLDNYNTYEKTEFLVFTDVETIPEMSIVFVDEAGGEDTGYIAAQKTVSEDEDGPYTISWYARRAYSIEAGIDTATLDFNITTSAGTKTDGVTTIPVAADTKIVFETSLGDPDAYYFAWYLTGDSPTLLSMDSTYEFAPTTAKEFDFTDGEPITIACVVSDDKGNWGSAVFQFVLTAGQSPIILYNNQRSDAGSTFTKGLAAFDTIEEGQSINSSLLDGAITDFCFDGNCNLYVVTGSSIVKYAYSLFSGYSLDEEGSLPDAKSEINAISCDTTNGYIFYLSGGTVYVYDPSSLTTYTLDDVSVDEEVYDRFSKTDDVNYSYSTEITNIAVSNHTLYIAMDVIQRGGDEPETAQIIARYTYEKSDESIALTRYGYVAAGASEVFSDTSSVAVTVNDMMVQDSKLYVLVSQQAGRSSSSVTHRGALLTITDNNGSLTLTSYGANDNNYAKKALDKDEKTFYAPQKFLAVMPKKLVIADEGFWIDESNNYGVVNRVVTVDLAEDVKDYSSEAVNVNVSFDLNISISACGSLYVDVK